MTPTKANPSTPLFGTGRAERPHDTISERHSVNANAPLPWRHAPKADANPTTSKRTGSYARSISKWPQKDNRKPCVPHERRLSWPRCCCSLPAAMPALSIDLATAGSTFAPAAVWLISPLIVTAATVAFPKAAVCWTLAARPEGCVSPEQQWATTARDLPTGDGTWRRPICATTLIAVVGTRGRAARHMPRRPSGQRLSEVRQLLTTASSDTSSFRLSRPCCYLTAQLPQRLRSPTGRSLWRSPL